MPQPPGKGQQEAAQMDKEGIKNPGNEPVGLDIDVKAITRQTTNS